MSKFSRKRPHPSNESARKHSGGEQFDLLPSDKRCKIFAVTFDFYTPRAHFIIVPRRMFPVPENYNGLDHTTRLRVVATAKAMVSHYGLEKSAILSVHFGSWLTTKDRFHVHVCVDLDDYLRVFETKEDEIPEWPSRKYVTRQWKARQDPNHYEIKSLILLYLLCLKRKPPTRSLLIAKECKIKNYLGISPISFLMIR